MTEEMRRVPFRHKPMGEKFQLVFFGHPEKRLGDKIVVSKWGFNWSAVLSMLAAISLVFFLSSCVTLRESDRRELAAECATWDRAIAQAERFESSDASNISWNLKGWKELDCQGGR